MGLEPKSDREILLLLHEQVQQLRERVTALDAKMERFYAQQRIRVPRAVWAALAAALMGLAGWCGRGMVGEQAITPVATERSVQP